MADDTIWYFAHPVAGDAKANVQRALRWLGWLRRKEPAAIIIAPWIASLLAGEDDTDPAQRERGLREAKKIAALADGIVLVGGRISNGMQRELDACADNGGMVCDLTFLGEEPPSVWQLAEYYQAAAQADPHARLMTVLDLGCREWEAA